MSAPETVAGPSRALATAFGLVMVASAALQADEPGLVAALVSAVAVVGSVRFAGLASVAVIAAAVAVVVSDAGPALAAMAGVTATCYLVLRHGGVGALTRTTAVAILGAAAIGLLAVTVPITLPWVPLLAPLAVLGAFAVAIRGLVGPVR